MSGVNANLVGSIGDGRNIFILDGEHYGYVTGNLLCINHASRGPRDFIWFPFGVSAITADVKTLSIALAPQLAVNDVEIIDFPTQSVRSYLPNSSNARLISLSFSYEGDRLLGLSEPTSHSLIGWNLADSSVLFVTNLGLDKLFNVCIINPCDNNSFALKGDGINYFGKIDETLGTYNVELDPMSTSSTLCSLPDNLNFLAWLPSSLALLCDEIGCLHTYRVTDKSYSFVGQIVNPHNNKMSFLPTCALVTLESIILGGDSGEIVWLNINFTNLIKLPAGTAMSSIIMVDSVAQYMKLNDHIVQIIPFDAEFESSLVKTGDIVLHVPLKLSQSATAADNEEGNGPVSAVTLPTTIAAVLLENCAAPIVMSSSCSIPILKSDGDELYLNCFLTLSTSNEIVFWRIPQTEQSSKKVSPETYQQIRTFTPSLETDRSNALITSMVFDSVSPGRRPLLLIGFSDGYFDIYKLSTIESEEDEIGNDDKQKGLFEEDGDLLILDVTQTFSVHLFESPLTTISCSSIGVFIACASYQSNEVYILKYITNSKLVVVKRLAVSEGNQVLSIIWSHNDNYVALMLQSGVVEFHYNEIASVDLTTSLPPLVSVSYQLPMTGMFISLGENHVLCQTLLGDMAINAISLPEFLDELNSMPQLTLKACPDIKVNGPVTAMAMSPDGHILALATSDGTLCIFMREDLNQINFSLKSRQRPHSDSVVTLTFSVDSKAIMSCACDGSYFFIKLETPYQNTPDIRPDVTGTENKRYIRNPQIWRDALRQEEDAKLKMKYADNIHEIERSLSELKSQLQSVIQQNCSRDPSEQLERCELIMDVETETAIRADINENVRHLKVNYSRQILLNEMITRRVRELCYDSMEMKSMRIYPIDLKSSSSSINKTSITSFPIRKYSVEESKKIEKIKRLREIEIRSQRVDKSGHFERRKGSILSTWKTSVQGIPSNIDWIDRNDPKFHQDIAKDGKRDASQSHQNDDDDDDMVESDSNQEVDIKSLTIHDLLYPALSIRTQIQKRSQMHMLKFYDKLIRQEFNSEFEKLKYDKDEVLDGINARVARIKEIQTDLGIVEQSTFITLESSESSDYDVNVFDYELTSRPYETEAMRQRRLEEEAELTKLESEKNKNNIKGRALQEMMDGVLEAKKTFASESTISHERPKWFDEISFSDMNDKQRREYEQYESANKQALEEKLKYRKSLEQELKKTKIELNDLVQSFNDRYDQLVHNKLDSERKLLVKELFHTLLASSMISFDYSWISLINMSESIAAKNLPLIDLSKRMKQIRSHMDEMQMKISAMQEEEKAMDKSFKRDIQALCNATFDQDTLKVFSQLFRSRQYQSSSDGERLVDFGVSETGRNDDDFRQSSRGSHLSKENSGKSRTSRLSRRGSNRVNESKMNRQSKARMSKGVSSSDVKDMTLGPMQEAARALKIGDKEEAKDAYQISIMYRNIHAKHHAIPIPINNHLKMEVDCPDGFLVEKFAWAKLQELRSTRIEKEIATKTLMNDLNALKSKYDTLKEIESKLENDMNSILAERSALTSKITDRATNLEFLINMKQGQDEVINDSLIIDYSKALLIPTSVINLFNQRITELGHEKISVLSKMKAYRRKNNQVNWETDHLDLMKNHLTEYYTDLQLLRVTKDLQQVIQADCDPSALKSKFDKFASRRDFLNKDIKGRLKVLERQKAGVLKRLVDRENESSRLEATLIDLKAQVLSRKDIKQFAKANITKTEEMDLVSKKMKKITARKQLVDMAKTQAEEIDFLRQELDRLRQRTFPSFVRSNRTRFG